MLEAFLAEHEAGSVVPYEAFASASMELDGCPVEGSLTVRQSQTGHNFEREIVSPCRNSFAAGQTATDAQGNLVIYMSEVAEYGVG